jgi:hypothetical protein
MPNLTVTIDVATGAGSPAKNRGIWMDGVSNFEAQIFEIILNHTFSVHTWIFKQSSDAMTVYSRDRDSFGTTTSHHHL